MKKIHLIYAACLLVGMGACAASVQKQVKDSSDVWKEYNTGAVLFEDKAPETLGSDIYHRIIPDAESYIKEQARTVLATLYNSPEDSIPAVHKIHYTLEDINGISAKGGGNGDVTIFYSTRHIEKSFAANDTAKLFFETRGVLLHELTHAYQLEPQGIGYFFVWLRDNKDPEFLRKFNRSTLEVIPWSFDGAIKHVLGDEYNIDELWHEYQVAVGDIQA